MSSASGTGEEAARRANRPLAGITVIDFGQIYQGPYATLLMAKAGADVIKVEPVGTGEPLRVRAAAAKGAGLPFAMLNSNKRAVTLNLKDERGRELLKRLVAKADVLLENFTPDVMTRLGVGWEVLRAINPRLIYASGSGYGLTGPNRDWMAMDLTVQASSGIMSVTGMPDGPPLKCGAAVVDFMSGIHLYAAVMTALYERSVTGEGRLVEVSMLESVFPALASNLGMAYSQDGAVPPRTGNRHGGLSVSPYNVYEAKDGHVAINVVKDVHFQGLLRIMGREDLIGDARFATNKARVAHMEETDALVEAWTRTRTRGEIVELATQHRLPVAPVRDLIEVMNDPHMHERGTLEWLDHPTFGRIVVPTTPLRVHGADKVETVPSPSIGQHNAAVYGDWLGLGADEIAALEADGVI